MRHTLQPLFNKPQLNHFQELQTLAVSTGDPVVMKSWLGAVHKGSVPRNDVAAKGKSFVPRRGLQGVWL